MCFLEVAAVTKVVPLTETFLIFLNFLKKCGKKDMLGQNRVSHRKWVHPVLRCAGFARGAHQACVCAIVCVCAVGSGSVSGPSEPCHEQATAKPPAAFKGVPPSLLLDNEPLNTVFTCHSQ